MTITDPRAVELVEQASRFDESALEHLANRGLVRRAGKLLSDAAAAENGQGLAVTGAGWKVLFPWEVPLPQGRCDCATAGVCQHVLAAIMHLATIEPTQTSPNQASSGETDSVPELEAKGFRAQELAAQAASARPSAADTETPGGPATPTIAEALLQVPDDQLLTWAKKTDSRWALERVESMDAAQLVIEEDRYLRVVLPPPHGEVRFMGPSLDDAIVKPSGRHDRRVVALGLLAHWLHRGRDLPILSQPKNKPTQLVVERKAVIGRSISLCEDLLTAGLLHLGDTERERLDSLAASARGVKLYRLAILAERASDHINALQSLSPDADTALLMGHLSEIAVVADVMFAMLTAGREVPIGLQGSARARYETIGHLDLIGLGHYQWGDHRFSGSTGVFAQSASRFFTVARPRLVNGRALAEALDWVGGVRCHR